MLNRGSREDRPRRSDRDRYDDRGYDRPERSERAPTPEPAVEA